MIGCEKDNSVSNSEEFVPLDKVTKSIEFDEYLDVSSSIDYYQLTMSSVPGLPLTLNVLKDDSKYRYSINISASAGHFLSWEDNIIEEIGDRVFMDYTDFIVYWSPLIDVDIDYADILIEVKQGDDIIVKNTYQIVLSDDAYVLKHTVSPKE